MVARRNDKALNQYLAFQLSLDDQTLFEGINRVMPGHYFLGAGHEVKQKSAYWDTAYRISSSINEDSLLEEIRHTLEDSVRLQLRSDVPLGAHLSGGLDSSLVSVLASQQSDSPVSLFHGKFEEDISYDESHYAKIVAKKTKGVLHEIIPNADDFVRDLPKLIYALDEPVAGPGLFPQHAVSKLAKEHTKVVLGGQGGDEIFGGYPWRYYKSSNSQDFEEFIDSYYLYWQRLIDNKDIKNLLKPIWNDVKDVWTRDIFRNVFFDHEIALDTSTDYINHSLYFEAKTFLHGLLLIEDKISMSFGLENRVPFLDNDLVDFAMSCPLNLKLKNLENNLRIDENFFGNKEKKYFQKTNDGKQILREALSKYLPDGITSAQKQGFSSPDATWFKGQSIGWVKGKLFNKNAKIYEFLDYNTSISLLNDHITGKKNRRLFIWSLLNLDEYLNQYV